MKLRSIFCVAALLMSGISASARDFTAGDLQIKQAKARATVANQPVGAAYVTIINTGKASDKLVALSSPVAKRVEMHTMSMDADMMMKMREVDNIEIMPGTSIIMKPGDGYHLMLIELNKPLQAGASIPLTMTFEKAGKVTVSVAVEALTATQHHH